MTVLLAPAAQLNKISIVTVRSKNAYMYLNSTIPPYNRRLCFHSWSFNCPGMAISGTRDQHLPIPIPKQVVALVSKSVIFKECC